MPEIISVFGNPDLSQDSLAIKLLPLLQARLPQFLFSQQNPLEECTPPANQKIWWIIDVVKNLKQVKLITNLDQLKSTRQLSLHDYDLGMQLALIKKINSKLEIKIIGLPPTGEPAEILESVVTLLTT